LKLSIRARLAVSFSLIFIVCLIFFSSVVYVLMSSSLEREFRDRVEHSFEQVLGEFNEYPMPRALQEMAEESAEFNLKIRVINAAGESIFLTSGVSSWEWPIDHELLSLSARQPVWSDLELNEKPYLTLTKRFTNKMGEPFFLQIASSRADIDRIRERLIYCINIGTPVILMVVFLVGYFFARKALEPVEMIRSRAESITMANLQDQIDYDGPQDELYRLARTLNDLLGRLHFSFDRMKRFIADASHELRIPLTGIRGLLEVALRQDRTKDEYKETIEKAHRESVRLSELVLQLLSLARADAGELIIEKEDVYLPTFLRAIFEEARALSATSNITVRLEHVPDERAVFDEAKIHQLLSNLIENAIRYNKPGGDVILSAEKKDRFIVIRVKDTGIGIAPDEQTKIFNRFYRVDKARSRDVGGTGLGLAIAKTIAEAHGGTLDVESRVGQGSQFTLTLPQ
jgi:heavy metal sensor kinase